MSKYNQEIFNDSQLERVHFTGIGGMGMSALAAIMLDLGYRVSGSDLNRNLLTDKLSERGAVISRGHEAVRLGETWALIYSSAVGADNPELKAARRRQFPILHRSDLLKRLLDLKPGLAVAGSHGKTSVAAQLSWMLEEAGFRPGFAIGGIVPQLDGNGRWGDGDLMVVEADESDGTFRKYNPFIELITGVDLDHFNFYKNEKDLLSAFSSFIERLDNEGKLVINEETAGLRELAGHSSSVVTYGFSPGADYRAVNIRFSGIDGGKYILEKGGEKLGEIRITLPGRCGVSNNLAAAAAALELGAGFNTVQAASQTFEGVKRRLEIRARSPFLIVEDYAHHPEEISAALEAVRPGDGGRLWCVFQPHRYSRLSRLAGELARALAPADRIIITDLYPAFEKPVEGVDAGMLTRELERIGITAPLLNQSEIVSFLKRKVGEGESVIIMGAGDVGSICGELIETLDNDQ